MKNTQKECQTKREEECGGWRRSRKQAKPKPSEAKQIPDQCQTDRQADRETDREADRQIQGQTDRGTDRQTEKER